MELTIRIPERLVERASRLGLPVDTLISQVLEETAREPIPKGSAPLSGVAEPGMTRQKAAEAIREIARTHTLAGLKIKELVEGGRRY